MKAIIFSAGLGTRLKPLTNSIPKALVKLNGKPLLYYAIQKVKDAGVSEIIVNVHHFADKVIDYLKSEDWGIPILVSDERKELLETGGGILFAKQHLENCEAFIAYNVDIITSLDLKQLVAYHTSKHALITLSVRKRDTQRYLMFNDEMQLTGWKNRTTGETKISLPDFSTSSPWAFSGIQVISSSVFKKMTEKGKFGVIPMYLRLAKTEHVIAFQDHSDFWLDLGKPGQLEIASDYLNKTNS